ncbi:MAG: zinc dependent phospholipase C family protein [Gammaproteobacteria bacterium]
MPGAYAHLTIANLLRNSVRLENIDGFPLQAIPTVLRYGKYIELGSVSPDYPYLALSDVNASVWADKMHYIQTGQMIHAGIKAIRLQPAEVQNKLLAWLLGYASHVIADVTIHPIIELKVGPYAQNKTAHRVCEMHQDVYIYRRMNLGDIGQAEFLDSGIGACGNPHDHSRLDTDIKALWLSMLTDIYGDEVNTSPPDIDRWHQGFRFIVDNIAEEGGRLIPIARHVAAGLGLVYTKRPYSRYTHNLEVPNGSMDYDEVFDLALDNVARVWAVVAAGILENDESYLTEIGNWNLDTGLDASGNLVFWS